MTQAQQTVSPHAVPWAPEREIVDLESLNAEASGAIIEAVADLRRRAFGRESSQPATAIVAVGPAGAGKTHLFARLRKKLVPRAVLVHVRPLLAAEMSPRFLLGEIVQQLGFKAAGDVAQIDLVAGAALALGLNEDPRFPTAQIGFLRELPEADRQERLDAALDGLFALFPEADPTYLSHLLQIPFAAVRDRMALIVWLSGREPDDAQAARIQVKAALDEQQVVTALRTIAAVSAVTAPLLIVFDQLENLVDASGGRIVAYGNLLAELVDTVRDVVIVQMGLSSEWDKSIAPQFGTSQKSRVAGKRIPLKMPSPAEARELIKLHVEKLPKPDAPFPWPFTEAQLQAVCEVVGSTPRMLLLELNRVLEGHEPMACAAAPAAPQRAEDAKLEDRAAIGAVWDKQLAWAREHIAKMEELRQGPEPAYLLDGFKELAAVLPSSITIEALGTDLARMVRDGGKRFLALVHDPSDASVRKAFRRLQPHHPLLAVRERWRDFPPTWRATREHFDEFRKRAGVQWLWLDRDDAVKLLALKALVGDARSADVEGADGKPIALEKVIAWAREELSPQDWTPALALLGKAPAEEPEAAATPPASASATASARILRALRVASMERVVRETVKATPGATRAAVLAELRANPNVRFLGETIVSWAD